jgi:hypothetical protein
MFATEFMQQEGVPAVWLTMIGRQTRILGTYVPVNIRVFYPAPAGVPLSFAAVVTLPRARMVSRSGEYLRFKDEFYLCFLSIGGGQTTRNTGDILVIRLYMRFFCNEAMHQRTASLSNQSVEERMLRMELCDGVSMFSFFNSLKKGTGFLKNAAKKYNVNMLVTSNHTIAELLAWPKLNGTGAELKRGVMEAALRSVNTERWDTMMTARKLTGDDYVHPPDEVFQSVEFLWGNARQTHVMNTLVSEGQFKRAVMKAENGLVIDEAGQYGTLDSGVLTEGFLEKLVTIRTRWDEYRKIYFALESSAEEVESAREGFRVLYEEHTNKTTDYKHFLSRKGSKKE